MLQNELRNPIIGVVFSMVIVLAGLSITPCLASNNAGAQLFHKGGTGDCDGCHLVHSSDDEGETVADSGSSANKTYRLKGSDPSSTCLNCHQAPLDNSLPQQHYISTDSAQLVPGLPPKELTPGGDFGWLKKSFKWGNNERSPGERHGHNIVAADYWFLSKWAPMIIRPSRQRPTATVRTEAVPPRTQT